MEDGICEVEVSKLSPGQGEKERHTQRLVATNFDFPVRPPRDLHYHVDHLVIVLIRVERDVVPKRDGLSVTQKPDPPVLRDR